MKNQENISNKINDNNYTVIIEIKITDCNLQYIHSANIYRHCFRGITIPTIHLRINQQLNKINPKYTLILPLKPLKTNVFNITFVSDDINWLKIPKMSSE